MTRSERMDQDHDDDMAMEDLGLDGQTDIAGRRPRPQSARKVASGETREAEILYTRQSVERIWRLPNSRISNEVSPVSRKTHDPRDTSILASPSRPSTKVPLTEEVVNDEAREVNPRHTSDPAVEKDALSPSPHTSSGRATTPLGLSNVDDDFRVSTPSRSSTKARPTKEGPATAKSKEVGTRRARHSIATGNPRATSGNDVLKKVTGNRVQKESGRMSLGGKVGGGDLAKRKEAMRKFLLKKQAEKARASGSPAAQP
ncbi:uncharacterized protein DNG_04949 [Cephalotrichum gorgonifer]|uniref:Uncharacterized protein n=1 Tax=Cephalotrichum gorgonifer TaxID=2041049 RepID=A0AAE8MX37_9PEZI|nr:uncharacterized protein DNG_04949 [Cephalotrichum gorgonifer]